MNFKSLLFLLLLLFSSCTLDDSGDAALMNSRAPVVKLPDMEGNFLSLRDFEGKVVLLNFWATWCPPCVAEMASLNRLHEAYKDKGFSVVAINVDPAVKKDAVREFIKSRSITFPILLDPELSTVNKFGVTGFPESVFITKDGFVAGVFDPQTKKKVVRVISERAWDGPEYKKIVEELLTQAVQNK